MAASLYDTGRDAFANGLINWTGDPISVALVGAGYTANMAADQFFSSVSGVIATMALTGKASAAGVCNAANAMSPTLATGSTITQIVIYKNTGNPATSQLIARMDVPATPTNGGTVTLVWDTTPGLKIFKL